MKVLVSKGGVLWGVLLLVGCILLVTGIFAQRKYASAVNFSQLDPNQYEYGDYVVGDIYSFLKKKVADSENAHGTGVSMEYIGFGTYEVYTIPIKNNTYVRIMVEDLETKNLLEAACIKEGEPIPFEGEIIKSPISLNKDWYAGIDGVDIGDIAPDFVIKQTDIRKKSNKIYCGVGILMIGIVLPFTGVLKNAILIENTMREKR